MTTTLTVDSKRTVTLTLETTQVAIIQGIQQLDLHLLETDTSMNPTTSSTQDKIFSTFTTKITSTGILSRSTISNKPSSSSSVLQTSASYIRSTTTLEEQPQVTESSSSSSEPQRSNGQVVGGNSLFSKSSSTDSNSNIGLILGIPIGVIGGVLLLACVWYYFKKRRNEQKRNADEALRNYYDDKYNYKMSPFKETAELGTSPYGFRSKYKYESKVSISGTSNNGNQSEGTLFNNESSISLPFAQSKFEKSELSLKEPETSGIAMSNWVLNTPLSKWFAKHSYVDSAKNGIRGAGAGDGVSSRASLSTSGAQSPMIVLKEFKLNKFKLKNNSEILSKNVKSSSNESILLPTFPESVYHPNKKTLNKSNRYGKELTKFEDSNNKITQHVIKNDLNHANISVPKIKPIPSNVKKQKHQPTSKNITDLNKPLPVKPTTTINTASTLAGLEQRIYERMIPSTPKVSEDFKDSKIYKVKSPYLKNLADEVTIKEGEFVKILARHTDGWCLIEKCDPAGKMKSFGNLNGYINDDRGVVPEMCLMPI